MEVSNIIEYIIKKYWIHMFWNVSAQYPSHNTDHYMVLGFLDSAAQREHQRYLGWRMQIPLRPPKAPMI